jgi:hypothetical protein
MPPFFNVRFFNPGIEIFSYFISGKANCKPKYKYKLTIEIKNAAMAPP